jgi:hypothetical protein
MFARFSIGQIKGAYDLWKLFNEVDPLTRKRVEELWDAHIWEQHRVRFLKRLEAKIAREPVPRNLSWAVRAGRWRSKRRDIPTKSPTSSSS